MHDPDSENELNWDFGMEQHYDNSNNDNKDHAPTTKGRPIEKSYKKKPSFLTVNKSSLNDTHTKKINEEDNDETMILVITKTKMKMNELS